jgi:uncharacterized membrane protein YbhN (UPF0104 family)
MKALRIAAIAATTVGAFALFLTHAHPHRLVAGLELLPLSSIVAAVAATLAGVVLGASRWRTLLAAGGTEAPTARLFAALTIGAAVNNLVPARGGDAVRVESAHQLTGASRFGIAGTMVAERLLDGFVLALLVVTGALLGGAGDRFVWAGAGLAIGIAVLAALAGRLGGRLARIGAGLAIFRRPGVAAAAIVTTAGIWLADVVMYGALARGFHLDVSFAALLLLVGAGNLALAVPGAAAGLGSFELLTLASAHAIGLGGAELAAFVLAVHAVIILPTTLVGLVLARVALPNAFRFGGAKPRYQAPA